MKIEEKIDKYLMKEEETDFGPKYRCKECGWIYDPDKEKKPFSEQPSSYKCPKCGAPKSDFEKA